MVKKKTRPSKRDTCLCWESEDGIHWGCWYADENGKCPKGCKNYTEFAPGSAFVPLHAGQKTIDDFKTVRS